MTFTRIQKREAYKKLSKEEQDFVMSTEALDEIESFLAEAGLSEEDQVSADNEIFCTMIGLQSLSEAIANIAKNTNKNISDLSNLRSELEETIFDEIYKIQKNAPSGPTDFVEAKEETETKIQKESSVGQSFEQIILNQAKAMQPARNASLSSASVAGGPAREERKNQNPRPTESSGRVESRILEERDRVPENLPIAKEPEQKQTEQPKVIHNYIGSDPYREPVE